MRLFFLALLTTLIVPLAAHAQAPKPVEVINEALAVEVLNLPEVQTVEVWTPRGPKSICRTAGASDLRLDP